MDGAEADILLSLARALVADGEPQRARAVLSLLPQQRFAQRVQAKALTRPLSKGTSPCALAVTTGNCERHRAAPVPTEDPDGAGDRAVECAGRGHRPIEIIRGPMSVIYGNNAFQGVVKIVTRPSPAQLGPMRTTG